MMVRVAALERQWRRKGVKVHLDDGAAVAISLDICVQFHLRAGDEVSADRVAEIREAQARHTALQSALRLLTYRPRSAAELRDRLTRKGIAGDVLEVTIRRVRDLGLIDDGAYARMLVENRDRTSPRGRRLIASELQAKGIDRLTVDESVRAIVDEDAAYRAAVRRSSALASLPYEPFRRRLTDFLLRRGFDHETTRGATLRVWDETGRGRPPSEELSD